jgi:mycothiol synthase
VTESTTPGQVSKTFGPLSAAARADVQELAKTVKTYDGVEAISEAPLLALAAGHEGMTHWLVRDGAGLLVGCAVRVSPGPSTELAVRPQARRTGVGRALIEALRAETPPVRLWAHGDLGSARAAAQDYRMRPVRELWEMASDRSGRGGAADPPAPADLATRVFDPSRDGRAWVELNALAFADHPEQGRLTLEDLNQRARQPWFDPSGLLLAEWPEGTRAPAPEPGRGSAVAAGYVWTKLEAGVGEIYAIGVHPAAQGRRLGTALLAAGLRHLENQGVREVRLFVEADNAPAIASYRRQGFKLTRRDVQYAFDT